MEQKIVTYDSAMSVVELLSAIKRGDIVVCPACGGRLIAALDENDTKRLHVHRGVYCENDRQHVSVLIDTAPAAGYWEKFKVKNE